MPRNPLRGDGEEPTPAQIEMMVRLGEDLSSWPAFRTQSPGRAEDGFIASDIRMTRKTDGGVEVVRIRVDGGVLPRGIVRIVPE